MIALKVLQALAQIGKEEVVCIAEIHCLELAGSPNGDRGFWKNRFSLALYDWYEQTVRLFNASNMEQKFYL